MSEVAGRLNERVVSLSDGARNAAGAPSVSAAEGPAWASITAIAAAPAVQGERLTAPKRWRLRMRSAAAPALGGRLRWRGRTLIILARTDDLPARGISEMIAEERAE